MAGLPVVKSTSVLLRVRNEGPYLIEWIAHYLALGFDDIVIVHNENDDGSSALFEILEKEGVCRCFESPEYVEDGIALTPGQRAVRTVREKSVLGNSKWLFTADADELLILQQHQNIHDFLEPHEDSDQIVFSWDLFVPELDSSRFDGKFAMRSRFKSIVDDYSFIKSITRVDHFPTNISPHRIIGKSRKTILANGEKINPADLKQFNGKNTFNPEWEARLTSGKQVASLYHYRFKSAIEFCMRQARGVAGPYTLKNNGMLFIDSLCSDPETIRKIDPLTGAPLFAKVEQKAGELLSLSGIREVQESVEANYLQRAKIIETESLTYRFIDQFLHNPQDFVPVEEACRLLQENPESNELLWLAAFCHRHARDYAQAYEISARAIALTPQHTEHHSRFVSNMRKLARSEKQGPVKRGLARLFSRS